MNGKKMNCPLSSLGNRVRKITLSNDNLCVSPLTWLENIALIAMPWKLWWAKNGRAFMKYTFLSNIAIFFLVFLSLIILYTDES